MWGVVGSGGWECVGVSVYGMYYGTESNAGHFGARVQLEGFLGVGEVLSGHLGGGECGESDVSVGM